MARRSEYAIAPADMVTATDDEVMETARLRQELSIERTPEDPPAPLEVIAQQLRAPAGAVAHDLPRSGFRRKAGRYGIAGRNLKDAENAHIRWSDIAVRPEHRRRGLGRSLSSRASSDRAMTRAMTSCSDHRRTTAFPSGEAFARALGASPGLPMKINHVDLGTVDRAKVAEGPASTRQATGWCASTTSFRMTRSRPSSKQQMASTPCHGRHRVQRLEAR